MTRGDEALSIPSDGRRLFAVFQPASAPPRAALLMVGPFGEEEKSAHRTLVETSRSLAERGVASLRLDLTGCGDSEGDFARVTVEDWLADIAAAFQFLRDRAPDAPPSALGVRLGAALLSRACPRLAGLHALILWQPVIAGRTEFASDLRRLMIQEMMTDQTARSSSKEMLAALERGEGEVHLDGYPVTGRLYAGIAQLDLRADRSAWPRRAGIVQFGRAWRPIEHFAAESATPCVTVDTPPIWMRSEFLPSPAVGARLAQQGVLPFLGIE